MRSIVGFDERIVWNSVEVFPFLYESREYYDLRMLKFENLRRDRPCKVGWLDCRRGRLFND